MEERPIVLITTVDIGGGKSEKIQLRQGDEPEDVARAFCQQHNIPDSVVHPLADHIRENLRTTKGADGAHSQSEQVGNKADGASTAADSKACNKLTFAEGMNDKLYEQLSAKLLPVDDNSKLLSVSASMGGNGRPLSSRTINSNRGSVNSIRSDNANRNSQSCEGSPTRVHNRLYKQAQDMKYRQDARRQQAAEELTASLSIRQSTMSWISQEMMKDRTHGPFDNYGEMLYAEGLEQAAVRQSKVLAHKAERDSRELEGATFMPQITRLAAALWSGEDLESQPVWQRLSIDKRTRTLARIMEMKKHREQQELSECTFHPRINKLSHVLMAERAEAQKQLQLTTHEQLYTDAVRRQQKMEELQKWLPEDATFQPKVNQGKGAEVALRRSMDKLSTSQPNSPRKVADDGPQMLPVVDRLYLSHERSKARLEELRAQAEEAIDPTTGRPYFKPEVGRAPRNTNRNTDGLSVNEYLYAAGLDSLQKKEAGLEAERQAQRDAANATHTSEVSKRLFDRLRLKRFAQIYEYLDAAGTGQLDLVGITRQPTAQMDNLDNEVREDVEAAAAIHAAVCGVPLAPEAVEGETANYESLPPAEPVDLQSFTVLMDKALSKRRKPRAYLVPSPSPKNAPAPTFQPSINKKSRELAARMRPSELPLHELLHHRAEMTKQRLEAARRQADEEAVAECTFAPRLSATTNAIPVEGRAMRAAVKAIAAGPAIAAQRLEAKNAAALEAAAAKETSRPAPARIPASHFSRQTQELEAELQSALEGVSRANARLGALDNADRSASSAAKGSATSQDLRATEAMLLDMLAASPHSNIDSDADADVINQLHKCLVTEPSTDADHKNVRAPGSLSYSKASSGSYSKIESMKASSMGSTAGKDLLKAPSSTARSTTEQQLQALLAEECA